MDPHTLSAKFVDLVESLAGFYWYCQEVVLAGASGAVAAASAASANYRRRSRSCGVAPQFPQPRMGPTTFTIRSSGGYQIVSFPHSPGARRARQVKAQRRRSESGKAEHLLAPPATATWRLVNLASKVVAESHNKDPAAGGKELAAAGPGRGKGSASTSRNKDFTAGPNTLTNKDSRSSSKNSVPPSHGEKKQGNKDRGGCDAELTKKDQVGCKMGSNSIRQSRHKDSNKDNTNLALSTGYKDSNKAQTKQDESSRCLLTKDRLNKDRLSKDQRRDTARCKSECKQPRRQIDQSDWMTVEAPAERTIKLSSADTQ